MHEDSSVKQEDFFVTILTTQSSQSLVLESEHFAVGAEPSISTHIESSIALDEIDKYYNPVNITPRNVEVKKSKKKVLRRLRGFIFEFDNATAVVSFIVEKEEYRYSFPKHYLARNGISEINQPFEMDELEVEDQDGLHLVTEFRPMAKIGSGHSTSFDLTDEEEEWYKTIQNYDYAED